MHTQMHIYPGYIFFTFWYWKKKNTKVVLTVKQIATKILYDKNSVKNDGMAKFLKLSKRGITVHVRIRQQW